MRSTPPSRRSRITIASIACLGAATALLPPLQAHAGIAEHPARNAQITWEDCPEQVVDDAAECGRIDVPTYHDNPEAGSISVGFVRQKATGNSRGAVFGNPGGPGGDGYSYFAGDMFEWPDGITQEWDRIAAQPRGLAGSTPVKWDQPQDIVANNPFTRPGGFWKDACENGTPGYTDSLTTQNTAHDWDWVREALGYDEISILGLSYGTYLGSAYASAYPQHTDRLILDSAMNPYVSWGGVLEQQKRGYDNAYEDFFTFAADRNDTYGLGTTPLAVYNAWSHKILQESGINPTNVAPAARIGDLPPGLEWSGAIGTEIIDATGQGLAQLEHVTRSTLNPGASLANSATVGLTHQLVPQPRQWDKLAKHINGSEDLLADVDKHADLSEEEIKRIVEAQTVTTAMQQLLVCNENVTPPNPALLPEYLWANYIVSDIPTASAYRMAAGHTCNGAAPVTGVAHLDGSELETQPLQISATGDPQTVYSDHQSLAETMNAHVVTVHGPGHGHVGNGNKVVDDIVVDYLRTGKTPELSDAPGFFDQ